MANSIKEADELLASKLSNMLGQFFYYRLKSALADEPIVPILPVVALELPPCQNQGLRAIVAYGVDDGRSQKFGPAEAPRLRLASALKPSPEQFESDE